MSNGRYILDVCLPYRGLIGDCLFRSLCDESFMFILRFRVWPGRIRIRRGTGPYGSRRGRGRGIIWRGAVRSPGHHCDRFELSRVSSNKIFTQCSPTTGFGPVCALQVCPARPACSRDGTRLLIGAALVLFVGQVVMTRRLRSISSLHAQPSHDTHYMTSSSAARSTSTQGLSPSVERRVEACQRLVLAAGH